MDLLTALHAPGPDRRDAVVVDGRAFSYEELLGAAGAVAARVAGAPAVAVHATPTARTVVAVVGALLAGVPVVPVPPDAGPAERGHILRDSGAALLLTGAGADHPAAGGEPEHLPVDPDERAGFRAVDASPDHPALILYTSGTTGAPKGVLIPRRAVAAGLDALAEAWAWNAEDTLVHGLPLFHVHGLVLGVLGALRTGSRLVHTGRPTPERYARAGGTVYFGVPTVWTRVVRDAAAARELGGARLLVSGSAPLPTPVFHELARLTGKPPVERYGMTETLITVSTRADGERRPGSVGLPVAGVATRLVGEDGSPVPYDGATVGELQVSGPTLFSGYLGRPEATAAATTADGWFRTGDMAVIGADGMHRIVGRASTDLIKSGGYRIGAGEVENALLDHPAVREAAVVGAPHPDLGQQIVAYVVTEGEVGERELIDFVAGHLSVHKRPRIVVFLPSLPRNAMGKPQKKLLPPV
ncbi:MULTISPECIES: acyl-CoA synthetase [Streptomycetaceae]|uniref:Acyl-CoA synthetase n=1 Tax=Streptantibioticus cattleyicolor (strain ATCC 35852 / DSM 46488 / JCM 4925 / NBRC 14057 / NRRL 8057) TaxID=1003195 RepID=F8JVG2_STREN|nr:MULTISPECIES: acyl-CoA synthetase [Streptomycetaceae]AEW94450.1 acyl-CoA synthetase [Streptantibioticus cattleyicolor NRRL 8057 = DSM 46488]MYS59096.1 AMP-binding protein [Streptomyces sp. SID5468]CCB74806.1 Acyl-CoA synthetase [Streptantibioticus cattleyicolor NRRL 8057 = DSM 46488]